MVGEEEGVGGADRGRDLSARSAVDGVPKGTTGTGPSVTTGSASTGRSRGIPATAKPVAAGGWACTTAPTSGRRR